MPPRNIPLAELWVIGDIHGAYEKVRALLLRSGLIDFDGSWTATDAHLVFLGDYIDRGPSGIEVVRLIRSLEVQAKEFGGKVTALMGNHEVMFLAALVFKLTDPTDQYGFYEYWVSNGGQQRDMDFLEPSDLAWITERPMMAKVGDWLMVHADSHLYLKLGQSIEQVNQTVETLLHTKDFQGWGQFLNAFSDRFSYALVSGEESAKTMLKRFGGNHIVHGHTPVYILLDEYLHGPTLGAGAPIPYAGKLCLAMDSGMAYREDAGFVARLNENNIAEVVSFPNGTVLY